jgi:hypothetical protein
MPTPSESAPGGVKPTDLAPTFFGSRISIARSAAGLNSQDTPLVSSTFQTLSFSKPDASVETSIEPGSAGVSPDVGGRVVEKCSHGTACGARWSLLWTPDKSSAAKNGIGPG